MTKTERIPNLKVGDKVWYVYDYERQNARGCARTVEKIATKWVTLTNGGCRFDRHTGLVSAGQYSASDRVWESEAAWRNEIALKEAWLNFRRETVCWKVPEGVTLETIAKVRELLGLKETA